MFNKRSEFTLIELIVVIAVLGILAAIVIPNISNFQQKAKEVQLTADVRNIQTAVDMYRLDQPNGKDEPVLENTSAITLTAYEADDAESKTTAIHVQVLDVDALSPDYLRKVPAYLVNDEVTTAAVDATLDASEIVAAEGVNFDSGEVLVGTMLKGAVGTESTAIVRAISAVDTDADGTPDTFVLVR